MSYIEAIAVQPQDDYMLLLTFENGEKRLLDMRPYLDKGVFKELRDISMFNTALICFHSIAWANDVDLAPETLYHKSIPAN